VCLLPGTELAFEQDVEYEGPLGFLWARRLGQPVARFRHINEDRPHMHHDALEFADGKILLLTHLVGGQHATVLQLPAEPRAETETPATEETRETIDL
jgi:hypothetical protein